jgi:lipopolysaccharide/colanic/teichoic acid biosynthesis glycosyltransferase
MASRADSSTLITGTFPVFEAPVADVPATADRTLTARVQRLIVSERLNRAVNFSIALVSLIVLAPLMLLIAVAVKATSRGPIVYRQTRVGVDRRRSGGDRRGAGERRTLRGPANIVWPLEALPDTSAPASERRSGGRQSDRRALGRRGGDRRAVDVGGRAFTMYKFRTMTVNAELEGAVWATRDDARVTPIGGILRGTRLDELPQLVNVLKGDMNVVGPRPERPSIFMQLRKEIDRYHLRQRAKPGITGWAQINQNYDTSIDDVRRKVEYDLAYIERRSVVEDMRIMARTLPVMIFRKGSH